MFKKQFFILAVTVFGGFTVFSASAAENNWVNWMCQSADSRVAPQIYDHISYFKALDKYANFASQAFHKLGEPDDFNSYYNCVKRP